MGTKDSVWVCWQEPAVDCGKTSQIPYSWVSEVLIGDGHAPGSVLKCRWPKTRRQYTAKVIAPPSGPQEKSRMNILRIPLNSGSGSGDEESSSSSKDGESTVEATKPKLDPNNPLDDEDSTASDSSGVDPVETSRMIKEIFTRRYGSNSNRSENQNKGAAVDDDGREQQPPFLVPETSSPSRQRQQISTSATSSSSSLDSFAQHLSAGSSSASFTKELRTWFLLQLNQMKTELLSNFDQVNHKITAMDLSIRNIRDRMDRMEGKVDLALLHVSNNLDFSTDADNRRIWEPNDSSNAGNIEDESEEQPPPLKRQRMAESGYSSASANKNDAPVERNNQREESAGESQMDSTSISAITVAESPPLPKRNARKSIVQRSSPISPPPSLSQEIQTPSTPPGISNQPRLLPGSAMIVRVSPGASNSPQSWYPPRGKIQNKRRLPGPLVAHYKPGSNSQIIFLGGNLAYEIPRQLYAEAVDNAYDESPVYLILSLVRRLFCDIDIARLWFKPDPPTQSDIHLFRPEFKDALKKQGLMQYPSRNLTERDYMTKLNQATYDAKHRLKRGKGSISRSESYFPLDIIAIPILPASDDVKDNSNDGISKESTNGCHEPRSEVSNRSSIQRPDKNNGVNLFHIKEENESDSPPNDDHETMTMLANFGELASRSD